MDAAPDKRARTTWDYALVVATVALLGALGVQSLLGTAYSWWAYRTQPEWETAGQAVFIGRMNAVAAPLVVALVLVMGLCVPKRIFSRKTLVAVSAGMLIVGVVTALVTRSIASGLTVYLGASALIQIAVVALTLAGSEGLAYLSEARLAKVGSGLLHLGFIVFAIAIVGLQRSPMMLPGFVAAALLLTGGSALSFYARPARERESDEAA